MAAAGEDIAALKALTDAEEIKNHLRLLNADESRVDAELDAALRGQGDLERSLEMLDVLRPQLGILKNDAGQLLEVVSRTAALAEKISEKVRRLDLEQSRVRSTMKLVEDIQELKTLVTGVDVAMSGNDFESAAKHIQRYLAFDPKVIESLFADASVDKQYLSENGAAFITPGSLSELAAGESPVEKMKKARGELVDTLSQRFDKAVEAGSDEGILRFFKLFPLIGYPELGLDKYATFVCSTVARKSQEHMRSSSASGYTAGPTFYADLLTKLFESVATVVDKQSPLVESTYGPGRMLRIMQRLQKETDIQANVILDTFMEKRGIRRKLLEVSSWEPSQQTAAAKAGSKAVESDIRELDLILAEVTLISQRTQLFDRFLHARAAAEIEKVKDSDYGNALSRTLDVLHKDGLAKTSRLDQRVQELMGHYVVLEEFFIRRSIDKAMKIDEYERGNATSSCVDDVFYILKKSSARIISTADPDSLCAMINVFGQVLEADYINAFQKQLSTAFPSLETSDSKIGFMVILNNVDVSCDYLAKLGQELDRDIARALGSTFVANQQKIESCISNLEDSGTGFRQTLKSWLENFFNQALNPRIKTLLQESYKFAKYVLTEEEYAEEDRLDAFAKRVTSGLDKIMDITRQTFTDANNLHVMNLSVEYVAKEWERHIFHSAKFNPLGAIRFDKDLRSITAYFTSRSQVLVRDKFARLSQMSTLLNLEKLTEIYDIWGTVTWRLTVSEVRKVLALRVDASVDAIARIKL
ncbi:COG4 transport protein-domain-containing protein [Hyaloraphidium curvatum]|nr:COG4 transport protein-domain-containing protein [Hyaloraphidium curvatum]